MVLMKFSKFKSKLTNFIKELWKEPVIFVYLITIMYVLVFTNLSFSTYFSLGYTYDTCQCDHIIWKMISGRPLYGLFDMDKNSFSSSHLHFSPINIFLAMVYFVVPTPLLLLFVQSLFIGLGAIPIYKLSKEKLDSKLGGLVFSISYLLYPVTQGANLFEFHTVVLSIPFLLWAFYFAEKNDYKKSVILSMFALFCQENVSFVIALLGIYIIFRKKKKIGLTISLLGVFWFISVFHVIFPAVYNINLSEVSQRFFEFGDTHQEIIGTIFANPVYVFTRSFLQERIRLLLQMLLPLSFFPLFSPALLIALPDYTLQTLANRPCLDFYCMAVAVPFTFIAAIYGVKCVSSFLSRRIHFTGVLNIILIIILFTSIYSNLLFSPFRMEDIFLPYKISNHYFKLKSITNSIPKNSTVIVNDRLCLYACHFKEIHILQEYLGSQRRQVNANFMIIDRTILEPMTEEESKILENFISENFMEINSEDGIEIYKSKMISQK